MDSILPPEETGPPPLSSTPPPVNPPSPPVISPMPAPRPARKRSAWKFAAIILLLLLVLSLGFNFLHVAFSVGNGGGGRAGGPKLEEVVLKEAQVENKKVEVEDKIAVLNVNGVITGEALDQGGYNIVSLIKEQLSRARRDKNVKAVLLKVDSPGGEVLASDEIAKAIIDFQNESKKPVVVSMGSLAASGGYYVSAPCEWIVANDLTITGSIGVIMHGFNYRGLLDKVGVRPQVYKSGKFKDMLSPTKTPEETSPEEEKMVQHLIDETYAQFKSVVADGRHAAFINNHKLGKELSRDWESFADGRILSGKEAYNLGFVDELGDFDKAVKRAEQLSGIQNANLIQYQPVFELANLLRIFGQSDAKSVKLDLGVELPQLRAGYMYFIWPTYLQ
jgi:protease-4